jgi:hypothetical protein
VWAGQAPNVPANRRFLTFEGHRRAGLVSPNSNTPRSGTWTRTGRRSASGPDHEKNERYRWLHVPDDLFGALLATLPPREDRDPDAPLFPDVTDASVRMPIKRACTATGTPHFSPRP